MKQFIVPVEIVVNSISEEQALQQVKEFMLASAFEFRKIYDIHDYNVSKGVEERK